uniref:NOP14 nucleolar protein n=1 Tax=Oryctolagus cuniculus TaxID=9986 RepID=A0A5F9CJ22_RABIT
WESSSVLGRRASPPSHTPGTWVSQEVVVILSGGLVFQRTQTLLKEYKERNKSNVFADRRFGEYDGSMSPEEKMMQRFALEQQKHHEKKSVYNLNEDEELTHYGQSLADIEKHHDVVDSDSDAEDRGTLSAELTAAHFGGGGGLLHKSASQQEGKAGEHPKSRRELIEELIAQSKQEKRERQAQREDALELTEKLDQDWKEIQTLLSHRKPKAEARERKETPKPDAYDMVVRELGFEMKAQPSNRMKTEEELAREEQERLRKLEADRLRRMRGRDEGDSRKEPQHASADDLDDGFVLDVDDRRLLSYRDGKMNVEDDVREEQSQEGSGTESEEEGADSEESDGPDSHSDLESNTGSEGEERPGGQQRQTPQRRVTSGEPGAAGAELPYTFAAPESYEALRSLLSGRPMEEQSLVVERIQKCNHPSLAEGNKAKLEKLFGFLLEYVGDLATSDPPDLRVIDKLVVQLYNLCQMFPEAASSAVQFVLRDAMHELQERLETRGRAAFPGLDVLVYLKIAGLLFPTSDFWHPVVTPALVCMSQLLTKCPVLCLRDVVKGLFVCSLFLDYVSLSRRFIPELLCFLLGILYTATPNRPSRGYTLVHPFRALGKNSELLLVSDQEDVATWQRGSLPLHWASGLRAQTAAEANHTRLSCLAVCLALLKHAVPLAALLTQHLADCSHPGELQELCGSLLSDLEPCAQLYRPLTCERTKPVPLKLFTPRLVKVLEFGRTQGSSRAEQERRRLIHKHRREFKGAVREIRKDNQFLARMQLSETLERDAERKRRVKQLLGSLPRWSAARARGT